MAERDRAARVIDRLQSRFREHVTFQRIFFEENKRFYTADKGFQEQIPDAGAADLVVSIFWARLGSELSPEVFGTMPDGRPYPGGAVYELTRALAAKRQKNLPDILVYRKVAETGISVVDPEQRRLMNHQLDSFEAFWREWFVSQQGHFRAGFQTFHRPDDFERLLDGHLRVWLDEHGCLGEGVQWRIDERGSPFRGLEPYEPQHSEVFFGRDRDIDRGHDRLLTAAMRGAAFLLIMGPSGAGKSSLARAGLVSRLTQPGDIDGVDVVRFAVMRPGAAATPQLALADAMFRPEALPELSLGDFPDADRLAGALMNEAKAAAAPILRSLERLAESVKADQNYDRAVVTRLLLVLDQLEELFVNTVSETNRTLFLRLVADLARSGRVFVIATLRSTSYGAVARETELMALKDSGATLDITVPSPEVLGDIVRRPAEAAGLKFDRRAEKGIDEELLTAAGANADALPLLGFTLQWLFEHRDGDRLTFAAYDMLGGLEGAIGRAAEQAFESLHKDAQTALPRLLRGLAEASQKTAGLALRNMPLTAAPEGTPIRSLADALMAARILVVEGENQNDLHLRLAHEAVLRGWHRAREITTKEQEFFRIREDVTTAEQRWRRNNQNSDLLLSSGLPIAEAESLKASYGAELPPELLTFIEASVQRQKFQQQRRQRRAYAVATALGAIAIAAIGAGIWALHQKEIAQGQQKLAERNLADAQVAQSRFLASLSKKALTGGDTNGAILLSLEGLPGPNGIGRPYEISAGAALGEALQRPQQIAVMRGHQKEVTAAIYSPDGRRVATTSEDHTARIWDAGGGQVLATLEGHADPLHGLKWSPDGRLLLTYSYEDYSKDNKARLWDANTGKQIGAPLPIVEPIKDAVFSPNSTTIATLSRELVRIWNIGNEVAIGPTFPARELLSIGFCPDSSCIVTSDRKTAKIWDVKTGAQIGKTFEGHTDWVWTAVLSPDGTRLATASSDHTVRLWDAATAQEIKKFDGHGDTVWTVAFSPDGKQIVSASNDRTARIWDAVSGKVVATLTGHTGWVKGATFSRDGKRILTYSTDGTARIWGAEYGESIAILKGEGTIVGAASFSPDGERVILLPLTPTYFGDAGDHTVREWSLSALNNPDVIRLKGMMAGSTTGLSARMTGSQRRHRLTIRQGFGMSKQVNKLPYSKAIPARFWG